MDVNEVMKNIVLEAIFSLRNEAVVRYDDGFYVGVFNVDTPTPVWEVGVSGVWYCQTPDRQKALSLTEAWIG